MGCEVDNKLTTIGDRYSIVRIWFVPFQYGHDVCVPKETQQSTLLAWHHINFKAPRFTGHSIIIQELIKTRISSKICIANLSAGNTPVTSRGAIMRKKSVHIMTSPWDYVYWTNYISVDTRDRPTLRLMDNVNPAAISEVTIPVSYHTMPVALII